MVNVLLYHTVSPLDIAVTTPSLERLTNTGLSYVGISILKQKLIIRSCTNDSVPLTSL